MLSLAQQPQGHAECSQEWEGQGTYQLIKAIQVYTGSNGPSVRGGYTGSRKYN